MMGKSHLLLGAAGYLGVAAGAPQLLGSGTLEPAELAAGALVAAGAAMLPDLDHPQGTVSRSLGPVTFVASRVVSRAAGGHRNGTHGLLCWAVVSALSALALASTSGPWVALAVAFLCASLMLRTLTEADGFACAALAAALAAGLVLVAPDDGWMAVAVCAGYGLHLLGDLVTTEGIPLLYPFNRRRLAVPVIGSTDRWRERTAGALCGLAACYGLATMVFMPAWAAQNTPARAEPLPRPAAREVSRPRVPKPRLTDRQRSELKRLRREVQRLRGRVSDAA